MAKKFSKFADMMRGKDRDQTIEGVIPVCGCRKPYQVQQLAEDAEATVERYGKCSKCRRGL